MNDTIKSANFDSVVSHDPGTGLPVYDRPLRGEDVRDMYKMIVSNGIYPNPSTSFQVLEGTQADEVIVKAGYGWVQGCPVWDMSDETVVLDPSDGANPRIDLIVLQWNNLLANRWVKKVVITGTAAPNPQPPVLTRNADIYEICLAEIRRPANTSLITQENITDTRGDDEVCGWSHGVVDQVDTSTIWNQYAAWLQDIQDQWENWWSTQQEVSGYMTTASDYVNLKTFDKKIIGSVNELQDDEISVDETLFGDGIVRGLDMELSGSTLLVDAGIFLIGGKPVRFENPFQIDLSGVTIQTGFVRVVINISMTANPEVWFTLQESADQTFPDLTRDTLIITGNLCQAVFAIIQIASGAPTTITDNGTHYRMYFYNDTHAIGRVRTSDTGFAFDCLDANGERVSGFFAHENGNTYINSNGTILFRPNSDSNGQVYINTNGQQIGGHPNHTMGSQSAVTLSANTGKALKSFVQEADGVYLVTFHVRFTPNSNSGGILTLGIATGTSNGSNSTSFYFTGTTARYYTYVGVWSLSAQFTLNFIATSSVAGTINSYECKWQRLS